VGVLKKNIPNKLALMWVASAAPVTAVFCQSLVWLGYNSKKPLISHRTRLVEKKLVRITEEDPACYHASW
jgi:hypothetical protein